LLISVFRGKTALILKVVVLAILTAVLLLLAQSALAQREYAISLFLVFSIVLINFTYFSKRTVPLKFFVPGLLLLVAFVVTPVLYTVVMSTYNYKTGNYISKQDAIERIKALALEPDEFGTAYDIVVGEFRGEPAILVSDVIENLYFISTVRNRIALSNDSIQIDENGIAQSAPDFTKLESRKISGSEAAKLQFKFKDPYFIAVESLNVGVVFRQSTFM